MTRATLHVTQSDIDASRDRRTQSTLDRQSPAYNPERDCPIGVALARTFAIKREMIRAHPDYLRIGDYESGDAPHNASLYESTAVIRAFMRAWDRYGNAEPKTFALRRI